MQSKGADGVIGLCCGLAALAFWGASIAVTRSMTEKLSPLTVGAVVYSAAGVLSCLRIAFSRTDRGKVAQLPVKQSAVCMLAFMGYLVFYYLAIGLSVSRQQTLEAGLMNHTWPTQTVLLSLVIVGARARWTLIPGLLLAVAGSAGQAAAHGLTQFTITLPCALAFFAAMFWAIYSNLTRRWSELLVISPLPLGMLLCGALLGLARFLHGGEDHWNAHTTLELAYSAICPTMLGYACWDRAMRSSSMILVVALSFLSPILSTLISSLYWNEPIQPRIWYGCIAIIGGAILCKRSLTDQAPQAQAEVPDTAAASAKTVSAVEA